MKLVSAKNGVKYVKSDILPCVHAFSTRIGGVSREAHTESLNLAFSRGDDRETVLRNLELFGEAVGFQARDVISVPQIHSNRVFIVDENDRGEGYFCPTELEGDGYVTDKKGIVLGVKTADCVPVLMAALDENGKAFAVGAFHAGWRGSVAKILEVGVNELIKLGAETKNIRVAIGPSICEGCYEVGEDFYETVCAELGKRTADGFICRHESDGRLHADVKRLNKSILLSLGVIEENIDICELCTSCEPNLFYSHRGMKGKRGTMLSVISL